jgi:HEAT repeat protein
MRCRLVPRFFMATGALVLVLCGCAREPVYEGKSLSQWMDGGFEDASRALCDTGPAAANCIFAKLKREHPTHGYLARYRSACDKLPGFCKKELPRTKTPCFDEWRACNALLEIGPCVIPSLVAGLKDRNFLVRSACAQTLARFSQRGSDIHIAVASLQGALNDPDPGVRKAACAALRRS